MSRTVFLPTLISLLALFSGRDSSASRVLPDAEFSFSASDSIQVAEPQYVDFAHGLSGLAAAVFVFGEHLTSA
jgi:hypothetical protein